MNRDSNRTLTPPPTLIGRCRWCGRSGVVAVGLTATADAYCLRHLDAALHALGDLVAIGRLTEVDQ